MTAGAGRADLLDRMADLLKQDIGPAIEAAYPKTQAFLGAVVLQKVAAELRLADEHAQAATAERAGLIAALEPGMVDAPAAVQGAFRTFVDGGDAELCRLIETLYAEREALGDKTFRTLRDRIRADMRRAIDRRMEIAS
ncbi:hypothetical protein [Minwuia sp.]|uniref:hypothetical protein n=1 Tax=Minwuia sp. TaxID=2493630 RepID=UPI003A917D22